MVSTSNSYSFNNDDLAAVVHHALIDVYTLSQQQQQQQQLDGAEADDAGTITPLSAQEQRCLVNPGSREQGEAREALWF